MPYAWHYLYVIVYPALGHKVYYGSRITSKHPDDDHGYFGSLRTFAHYNQPAHPEYQSKACKVIIFAEYVRRNKVNARKLSAREKRLIKEAHQEHGPEFCLNRNAAGRFILTTDELSAAGKKSVALGNGLLGLSPAACDAARRRGGATRAKNAAKTYALLTPDNKRKIVHNMRAFCREHALSSSHMFEVANGLIRTYKGWRKA